MKSVVLAKFRAKASPALILSCAHVWCLHIVPSRNAKGESEEIRRKRKNAEKVTIMQCDTQAPVERASEAERDRDRKNVHNKYLGHQFLLHSPIWHRRGQYRRDGNGDR